MKSIKCKTSSDLGITRLSFILAVIALVLFASVAAKPLYHYFVDRSEAYGCGAALATANSQLRIDYLSSSSRDTEEACLFVAQVMDGWDDLCPGGGDCYVVDGGNELVPYEIVCTLHGRDSELNAGLCAKNALSQTEAALSRSKLLNAEVPESISITLNSRPVTVILDRSASVPEVLPSELRKAGGAIISFDEENYELTNLVYITDGYIFTYDPVTGWSRRYR